MFSFDDEVLDWPYIDQIGGIFATVGPSGCLRRVILGPSTAASDRLLRGRDSGMYLVCVTSPHIVDLSIPFIQSGWIGGNCSSNAVMASKSSTSRLSLSSAATPR